MDISSASSTSYPVTIEQISEHLGFGQPKPLLTIIQEENDQIKSRLTTLEAGLIQHATELRGEIKSIDQKVDKLTGRMDKMEQTLSKTNELLHKVLVKLAIT